MKDRESTLAILLAALWIGAPWIAGILILIGAFYACGGR